MKFRAERAELTDATAWALRLVGARAALPRSPGCASRSPAITSCTPPTSKPR